MIEDAIHDESDLPLDIRPTWLPLIRRIQSVTTTGGLAVVSVHFLVNEQGDPMLWLPPKCQRIEPSKKARAIITALLERDGFSGV